MTQRPVRKDWWTMLAFLCASLALRVPFRSAMPYHWDSVEFTLALKDFNVALSQPHAPGYFLYVVIGRLINVLVGDPHASLVWVSVVAGSALVPVMYRLGEAMFDHRVGLIAALLTLTSPQTWFHSEVALTYELNAFLVAAFVLVCWLASAGGCRWGHVVVGSVLLAAIGGVRQQTAPALLILAGYTLWKGRPPRLAKLAAGGIITVGLACCWLLPMVGDSGGWTTYLELVRRLRVLIAPRSFFGSGWAALGDNLACMLVFCWNGLGLAAVALLGVLFYRATRLTDERRREWDSTHGRALLVLALWILPLMVLGAFGVTEQPGHVLDYLTGLLLLAAVAISQLRRSWRFGATLLVVAANTFCFLAWPEQWDSAFWRVGRTAREIREHDHRWAHWANLMRGQFDPSKTIICFADSSAVAGVRHAQVWLPEFASVQLAEDPTMLAPPGKPLMAARGGKLAFMSIDEVKGFPVKVLVVLPHWRLERYAKYFDISKASPIPDSDGFLFSLGSRGEGVP
jgi:hypothetical protein